MMKKIILFFAIFVIANISFPQSFNWITPNQTYLKMYVVDDGICRINKGDFTAAGVNADVIDPRTIKIYYKGLQVPSYVNGEQDGVFNDTDYVDFFGKRNYGGVTNTYNSNNDLIYTTDEYNNFYSDTSVYWIGWGGAYGTRFPNYSYNSSVPYPLDYYYKKLHFERDLYYSYGEQINEQDYRNFNNEKFQGEGWYWQQLLWLNTIVQTFTTPYLSTSSPPLCMMKIFAYPNAQSLSVFNEHRLLVTMNNTRIDTVKVNDFSRMDTTIYFPASMLNPSSTNTARLKYTPPDALAYDVALNFDMFEISYPRYFAFDSNKVSFSTNSSDTISKIFKIKGFVSSNPVSIYDVKNGLRISSYSLSADTLVFTGKGDGVFEINNKNITKKPFRIKQRTVPAYATTSNGVDYLVIYNKLFESQAEQLRAYRNSHDGFRSVKAEMEDIYDIFNYGIEHPVAIRNFSKYIYDNWQLPKISYICLFGRASLDPKKCSSSSVYYQNFVPVYGNPPSDGYFANFNLNTFTYFHQVAIGRLPVYTAQEAQDVVNKIIAFESQPLDSWIKKSVFVSGGYNKNDQIQFVAQSNNFLNNNIFPPPLSMSATKIYFNDTSGLVTFNSSDSIRNTINRGAGLVSYIGHSGNGYWDYAYENPGILSNGNKLPLVFSMTCFTGKNAEPTGRGYGEKYFIAPGKGAIGFISSTGWSFFPQGGNVFEQYFLAGYANDSLRRFGDLMKYASAHMYPDSGFFTPRNTINCYNLIGDPAVKFLNPKYPEFDIQLNDYSLSNRFPAVRDNITLKIFPKNLGTYADSCKVRFQVLKNNDNHSIKDTVVHIWGFVDTIAYNFKLDTVGLYSMKVTLDVDNWYTQELTSNNTIVFPLTVKNTSFVPIKPVDNSIIRRDTVEIVGINPNINPAVNSVKLLVQIDTVKTFSSPMLQTYFNNNMSGAATKFKIRIPQLDTNIIYYWRLNTVVNNTDTLGWSEVKRYRYNVNIPPNFALVSRNEKSNRDGYPDYPGDSNVTIYKNKTGQYNDNELSFVYGDYSGMKLGTFNGSLTASSWGGDPWSPTYYIVNGNALSFTRPEIDWGGLILVKVSKLNGAILNSVHVYMSSSSSSDSVLNFLNSYDSSHILVALKLIATSITSNSLNANAINKFHQFGSVYIDSMAMVSWDKWSFISIPGSPSPVVSEAFNSPDWIPVTSSLQYVFKYTNGNISQVVGPARTWKNFSWQQILYPGSNIKFDVYGIDQNNAENLLMANVTSNTFVDLQSVNSFTYPYIRLVSKFNIDSLSGWTSPILTSMKFNYVAPSEIALDYITFIRSDSLLNGGDSLGFYLSYYNVGYVDLNGYVRTIYTYDNNGQKITLKTETINSVIKVDSMDYVKTYIQLNGIPNIRKYNNYIVVYVAVSPLGNQNDLYTYNNVNTSNIVVKGTSQITNLELFSDGTKITGGEYVRNKPDFEIRMKDKLYSGIGSFDTTDFKLFINNIYRPYNPGFKGGLNIEGTGNRTGILIKLNPELSNGENNLKMLVRNKSGEGYDTTSLSVFVSTQLLIKDFYNYPNPMKNQTGFIFNLGGSNPPSGCRIKIYTVSGRLIKVINTLANIGFNQVNWDGRDNEGDYMANGVYLYRMLIEGDTKIESPVQKLVILK
jgi:hypothetical protein